VFENQKEALDLLKQFRSARFKVFDNYQAALDFSQESAATVESSPGVGTRFQTAFGLVESPKNKSDNLSGKSDVVSAIGQTGNDSSKAKLESSFETVGKQFPSLKENLLTRFRRAIESGNMAYVSECVDNNPKYLINSCEIPVILFAGNRYNAVHCACKTNQVSVLRYILDHIADESYVNRLFEDRNTFTSSARCHHLLDFYLNTPDKIVSIFYYFISLTTDN
jgi:hypothetical protein